VSLGARRVLERKDRRRRAWEWLERIRQDEIDIGVAKNPRGVRVGRRAGQLPRESQM
jgi:hypothetical protein